MNYLEMIFYIKIDVVQKGVPVGSIPGHKGARSLIPVRKKTSNIIMKENISRSVRFHMQDIQDLSPLIEGVRVLP